jgi:hypothetical protein
MRHSAPYFDRRHKIPQLAAFGIGEVLIPKFLPVISLLKSERHEEYVISHRKYEKFCLSDRLGAVPSRRGTLYAQSLGTQSDLGNLPNT